MPGQLFELKCTLGDARRYRLYLPARQNESIPIHHLPSFIQVHKIRPLPLAFAWRWYLYPAGLKKIRFRIDLLWHLNLLLSAGISVSESCAQLLRAGGSNLLNACLVGLLMDIHQGRNLAQASARLAWLFPNNTLQLLYHTEQTGKLDEALGKIIENDEWLLANNKKILQALLYPGLLIVFVLAIVAAMIYLVIPNYALLLADGGKIDLARPPWWLSLSDWMHIPWVYTGAIGLLPVVLIAAWLSRHHICRLLPATASLHHSQQMYLFGFLYDSGIHLPNVLQGLADNEPTKLVKLKYLEIVRRLKQGHSLGDSFAQYSFLPPLVVSLLRAGESCGRLGYAAQQAGLCLEREANDRMKTFEQWCTPVLLLVIGGLMAWLFTSLLDNFYDFNT